MGGASLLGPGCDRSRLRLNCGGSNTVVTVRIVDQCCPLTRLEGGVVAALFPDSHASTIRQGIVSRVFRCRDNCRRMFQSGVSQLLGPLYTPKGRPTHAPQQTHQGRRAFLWHLLGPSRGLRFDSTLVDSDLVVVAGFGWWKYTLDARCVNKLLTPVTSRQG